MKPVLTKISMVLILCALFVLPCTAMAASGKIVIAQGAEQRAVDAHKGGSTMFVNTSQAVYDTLMHRNPAGKLVPGIATSWKYVSPTVLEFKLRKGVKFHNGEALTASDVKFSLDRMRAPETKYPMRAMIKTISEVKVVDDVTIQVITQKPDFTLMGNLATYGFLVPEDYIKEHGDQYFGKNPIGSGRYRFVKWVQSDYIELEAFPGYWGEPATVKTLIFKVIPEKRSPDSRIANR